MLIGIVAGFNLVANYQSFLTASAAQVLTLLIALSVAFWANQYKNDQRKSKEHVERIILKIQNIVSDEEFSQISSKDDKDKVKKQILIRNRKVNNYISILKDYSNELKFDEEIKYIENEFIQYKEKTGAHIEDLDYLSKTEDEFRKNAENIDTKCENIILKLYK